MHKSYKQQAAVLVSQPTALRNGSLLLGPVSGAAALEIFTHFANSRC